MSATSTAAPTGTPTFVIDHVGPGQYLVADLDPSTGKPVHDSKAISEDELNKRLAPFGLKIVNGELQALDGFELSPNARAIVTDFGGAPVLPGDLPNSAPRGATGKRLSALDSDYGVLAGIVFSILADSDMQAISNQRQLTNLYKQQAHNAGDEQLGAEKRRIDAGKGSATLSFFSGLAASGASFATGMYGYQTGGAFGAGLEASSQSIGMAITGFSNWLNENHWFKKWENQAVLDGKKWEQISKRMDDFAETHSNSARDYHDAFKTTLQIRRMMSESDSNFIAGLSRI